MNEELYRRRHYQVVAIGVKKTADPWRSFRMRGGCALRFGRRVPVFQLGSVSHDFGLVGLLSGALAFRNAALRSVAIDPLAVRALLDSSIVPRAGVGFVVVSHAADDRVESRADGVEDR